MQPTTDFFAQTGCTFPWYGLATYPNAVYISAINETWIGAENWYGVGVGGLTGPARRVHEMRRYNHASKQLSAPIFIGTAGAINDDHGVDAHAVDYQFYDHVFFGPHQNSMQHCVTANPVNSATPVQYLQQVNLSDGKYTYPHPVSMGIGLYLFMREATNIQNEVLVLKKTTSLNNGVAVWGSPQVILDYGTVVQIATNAVTNAGSAVLNFASTTGVANNQDVVDLVTDGVIPNNTAVSSFTPTTVTLSATVTAPGVGSGDNIWFGVQGGARVYIGETHEVGTEIHFMTTRADANDSFRKDAYYYIFDTTDGGIWNFDKSVKTPSASLPIGITLANASYKIYTSTNAGFVPSFCFDASGKRHIIISDGSGTNFPIFYANDVGGTLSAFAAITGVATTDRFATYTIVSLNNGNDVEVWWSKNEASFGRGGSIFRIQRTGGSFGSPVRVKAPDGAFPLDECQKVKFGLQSARVCFTETTGDAVEPCESGALKEYLSADIPVRMPVPPTTYTFVNAEAQAYNNRRTTKLNYVWSQRLDDFFTVLKTIGLTSFDALYWSHDGNDVDLNLLSTSFTLTRSGGITLPALSVGSVGNCWKGDGSTGKITSGFIPSSANGAVTLNSAHLGLYFNNLNSDVVNSNYCASTGPGDPRFAFLTPNNGGGALGGRVNDSTTQAFSSVGPFQNGLFGLNRSGPTTTIGTHNGFQVGAADATASISLPATQINLFTDTSVFSDRQIYMAHWGASLTLQQWLLLFSAQFALYAYDGGMGVSES